MALLLQLALSICIAHCAAFAQEPAQSSDIGFCQYESIIVTSSVWTQLTSLVTVGTAFITIDVDQNLTSTKTYYNDATSSFMKDGSLSLLASATATQSVVIEGGSITVAYPTPYIGDMGMYAIGDLIFTSASATTSVHLTGWSSISRPSPWPYQTPSVDQNDIYGDTYSLVPIISSLSFDETEEITLENAQLSAIYQSCYRIESRMGTVWRTTVAALIATSTQIGGMPAPVGGPITPPPQPVPSRNSELKSVPLVGHAAPEIPKLSEEIVEPQAQSSMCIGRACFGVAPTSLASYANGQASHDTSERISDDNASQHGSSDEPLAHQLPDGSSQQQHGSFSAPSEQHGPPDSSEQHGTSADALGQQHGASTESSEPQDGSFLDSAGASTHQLSTIDSGQPTDHQQASDGTDHPAPASNADPHFANVLALELIDGFDLGSTTLTKNSASALVVDVNTLAPGAAITEQGNVLSLAADGKVLVINGTKSIQANAVQRDVAITFASDGQVTIGTQTLQAKQSVATIGGVQWTIDGTGSVRTLKPLSTISQPPQKSTTQALKPAAAQPGVPSSTSMANAHGCRMLLAAVMALLCWCFSY